MLHNKISHIIVKNVNSYKIGIYNDLIIRKIALKIM